MQPIDARILRGAAIPTCLAGIIAILIGLLLAGGKGAIGAAIGVTVVVAFFSIGLIAVVYAGRNSPVMMMPAALISYMVKLLAMYGLVALLSDVTVWNPRTFAWTVIALTLVWLVAEYRTFTRLRMFYVEPGSGPGDTGTTGRSA